MFSLLPLQLQMFNWTAKSSVFSDHQGAGHRGWWTLQICLSICSSALLWISLLQDKRQIKCKQMRYSFIHSLFLIINWFYVHNSAWVVSRFTVPLLCAAVWASCEPVCIYASYTLIMCFWALLSVIAVHIYVWMVLQSFTPIS